MIALERRSCPNCPADQALRKFPKCGGQDSVKPATGDPSGVRATEMTPRMGKRVITAKKLRNT